MEAHPGAAEACTGAVEAHLGVVKANPGALEAHLRAFKTHPEVPGTYSGAMEAAGTYWPFRDGHKYTTSTCLSF
jgi:hypothetical protein